MHSNITSCFGGRQTISINSKPPVQVFVFSSRKQLGFKAFTSSRWRANSDYVVEVGCAGVSTLGGCQMSPRMLPVNISKEPIMKPHIVGKAITEAIRTSVAPIRTLFMCGLFIRIVP